MTRVTGLPFTVTLEPEPGTYALLLHNDHQARLRVGRLGRTELSPGYYLYTGSAHGPGGLQSRVSRHLGKSARKHWHIDYLRAITRPTGLWYSYSTVRLEHRWAAELLEMAESEFLQGFGCSDCSCPSHLLVLGTSPDVQAVSAVLASATPAPVHTALTADLSRQALKPAQEPPAP